MAAEKPIEFLTASRFYFEYGGNYIPISSCTGITISIETTGTDGPTGVTKGLKVTNQPTPTGVVHEAITLEFVSSSENKVIVDWYNACHPSAAEGGATQQMSEIYNASLVAAKQDASPGITWQISNAIATKYTTSPVDAEGGDLFKETVEISHTYIMLQ